MLSRISVCLWYFLTIQVFLRLISKFIILAQGKFVVVVDNEERENEGDLVIAAEKITTEKMAFMVRHTR